MYVRAHIYQHPLFATRRIVAPRPAAYTDTIVEISITVSLAINPIPRAAFAQILVYGLPYPFGSRRNHARLREAGQADIALIYSRNCLARYCLRNYDNVQWYLDTIQKNPFEPRTDIAMQIRWYHCQSASGLGRLCTSRSHQPSSVSLLSVSLHRAMYQPGFVPGFLVYRYYRSEIALTISPTVNPIPMQRELPPRSRKCGPAAARLDDWFQIRSWWPT